MAAEACRTGKMLAVRITRSLMTQRSYSPLGAAAPSSFHHAQTRDRPVAEDGFTVNQISRHKTPHAAVVAGISMIPEHKIMIRRDHTPGEGLMIPKFRFEVRFLDPDSVNIKQTHSDLDHIAGHSHHALDERLVRVSGIPENHDVAPLDIFEAVDEPVYEDPLLIHQARLHAGSFDFHRLDDENDDEDRDRNGQEDIPGPGSQFGKQIRP